MNQHDSSPDQPKRTPEEIISAILAVADSSSYNNNDSGKRRGGEGATKLKIMADVFISFRTATDYLDKLQQNDLIEYHAETNSYQTTEKGKKLLLCDSR